MAVPSISEIKYFGGGTLDMLEVRIPVGYPDPENLVMVIYDLSHNGSTTGTPSAADTYSVVTDGNLYTEDLNGDGIDDDGVLHYTFGSSENGVAIKLHAQDAVGLYNSVTGETFGLYSFGAPYTVSTASADPFAGQAATVLDTTGQVSGVTSLSQQQDGTYTLNSSPTPGSSYICFAAGTQILTQHGPRRVEDLSVGDFVVTKDKGLQKIKWLGQRHFGNLANAQQHLRPIRIQAGAFGAGVPHTDINLSPNHAVMIDNWKTTLYCATSEALTLAKHLLFSDRAYQSHQNEIT